VNLSINVVVVMTAVSLQAPLARTVPPTVPDCGYPGALFYSDRGTFSDNIIGRADLALWNRSSVEATRRSVQGDARCGRSGWCAGSFEPRPQVN